MHQRPQCSALGNAVPTGRMGCACERTHNAGRYVPSPAPPHTHGPRTVGPGPPQEGASPAATHAAPAGPRLRDAAHAPNVTIRGRQNSTASSSRHATASPEGQWHDVCGPAVFISGAVHGGGGG